jgi:hypothetical protein
MNFDSYRFYHCIPNDLGDFTCHRITSGNFIRAPNSRIIIIEKSFPKFLDKYRIMYQVYPMDVTIVM